MNQDAVKEIARRHQQLERVAAVSDDAEVELAQRKAEEEEARDLWGRLGRECQEYCDYYNGAIGEVRVFCELHDDTIVVRSHADSQNTVVLSRTPGAIHAGTLTGHRYRYPRPAAELPVGLRVNDHSLTLTYEGQELSPADLVLRLLSSYTEELVTHTVRQDG